jgi:hypothetical protein
MQLLVTALKQTVATRANASKIWMPYTVRVTKIHKHQYQMAETPFQWAFQK